MSDNPFAVNNRERPMTVANSGVLVKTSPNITFCLDMYNNAIVTLSFSFFRVREIDDREMR